MIEQVDDIQAWSNLITSWAHSKQQLFFLSSCGQPSASSLESYELVVGVGIQRRLVINQNNGIDYDAIRQFLKTPAWSFFCLSYDLNRDVAGTTQHAEHDELNWPLMCLVEPEHVVTLSRIGQLEIISPDAKKIFADIQSGNPVGAYQTPKLSMGYTRNSMTSSEHYEKVEAIREEIAKGNMYEMNLCMETAVHHIDISDPFAFHRELLAISPTPFSSYVQLDGMHLMCASPERYIRKSDNRLHCQPIKGTSARHLDAKEDGKSREYLRHSIKERAEHVMIVDLVRNDLGRVGVTGSVTVDELCGIYGYRQVYQMVSTISCEPQRDVDIVDIVKNTFPMGSMTGAPKQIVMEYIGQLETAARGWFSGSVGYIKPDGDFDSNVVIRSILYDENLHTAKYSVGGAITYDSDPQAEYQECLLKSSAIRQLFQRYASQKVSAAGAA